MATLTSTTTLSVTSVGTDANGNQINQTLAVAPVSNTSATVPAFTQPLALGATADTTTTVPTGGFKQVTIIVPAGSTIFVGARTGGQATVGPVTLGISGSSLVLGNGTASPINVQLIWS